MVAKAETCKTSEELVDIARHLMCEMTDMDLSDAEKCMVISLMHNCDTFMMIHTTIKEQSGD